MSANLNQQDDIPQRAKYRSIPVKKNQRPKIIIVGGGIAGLTVAHELVMESQKPDSQCKFDIVILEKNEVLGGKARTTWENQSKKFAEHSMRVLPGSYVCMHQIMKEIPNGTGNVYEKLTPVTIQLKHGKREHVIHGDYHVFFLGSLKYVWDVICLLWFLFRTGVRARDLLVFLGKIIQLMYLPSRRVTEQLSRLKFSEYVGGEDGQPGRFDIIYRIAEILVAAKSHSSAGVVSHTLLEWFITPFLRGKHVRHAVSEFTASTSDALITPWVKFLKNHNVKFEQGTVKEIDAVAGKVNGIKLENEKELREGDVYVLAVQHNLANTMIGDGLRSYLPALADFPKLGEEWAHSVQFQVPELRGKLANLGSTSVASIDSPWSIAYRVYSRETWKDDWQGTDEGGVLTATISNTKRPGKIYHLPFLRCTPEQILEEVISQTGLQEELGNADGALGLDIEATDPEEAEESKKKGYAVTAIGSPDNRVFVSDAQMYIRLPGNLDIEPENGTEVYNFFLAGEYTRTQYRIPTMEKSCESGKRCAKAIIAGIGCGVPRDVPIRRMPLGFLRSEYFHFVFRIAVWVAIVATLIWLVVR